MPVFAPSIIDNNDSLLTEYGLPFNSAVEGILGRVTNKINSPQSMKLDFNQVKLPNMFEQQVEELFHRLDRVETRQNNPFC